MVEEIQEAVWYIIISILILSIIIVFAVSFQPSIKAGFLNIIGTVVQWLVKPVI